MAVLDQSVSQAVAKAQQANGKLTYSGVQDIIRGAFDYGIITVQEREDLHDVLTNMPMDGRATRALTNFLTHVDKLSASADQSAKLTGNKNIGVKIDVPDTGPFSEFNTDLDKFSHGNFDVAYDPNEGELNVTLKVKFGFDKHLTTGEQTAIRARMYMAVKAWDNAQATLESSMFVLNPVIRVRFIMREVNSGEHKTVDVENDPRREWVGMDINIHKATTVTTLTHELGHVFGNYDEYKGGGFMAWVERRMYWHDNRFLSDTTALMNSGSQFRTRYFDHFQRFVNKHFAKVKAWYGVRV
jgi:muconolactone delta-isomerase